MQNMRLIFPVSIRRKHREEPTPPPATIPQRPKGERRQLERNVDLFSGIALIVGTMIGENQSNWRDFKATVIEETFF